MTCIVGIIDEKNVWVGGDSAGSANNLLIIRKGSKVFKNKEYLIGFSGSFRMGDVLRYEFKPPTCPTKQINRFIINKFVPELKETLRKTGALSTTESNVDTGLGGILIAVNGKLFSIHSDFQVGESADGFEALGSGNQIALGALSATANFEMDSRTRMKYVLEAAEKHSAYVRRPFTIMKINK